MIKNKPRKAKKNLSEDTSATRPASVNPKAPRKKKKNPVDVYWADESEITSARPSA